MNSKFYISKENKKAYDKLSADGYKLTEGKKEYHPKNSKKLLNRPIIGEADIYWVEWTGSNDGF